MSRSTRNALAALICGGVLLTAVGGQAAFVPRLGPASRVASAFLPPPLFPGHGYAHAHRSGALLRFDAELGVYAVIGAPNLYYFGDAFIRIRAGLWEFSARPYGPWTPGRPEWVPVRLRAARYREAIE